VNWLQWAAVAVAILAVVLMGVAEFVGIEKTTYR
jgi:hypothetical protein